MSTMHAAAGPEALRHTTMDKNLATNPSGRSSKEVLTIAAGVQLNTVYSVEPQIDKLLRFADAVAERYQRTGNFCRSVKDAALAHKDAAEFFQLDIERECEAFGLKQEFLFCDWKPDRLWLKYSLTAIDFDFADHAPDTKALSTLIRGIASGIWSRKDLVSVLGDYGTHALALLDRAGAIEDRVLLSSLNPRFDRPGIHRLQHAGLLYRSSTHGVLIDPHFHSSYGNIRSNDIARFHLRGLVDAILISHFHGDHWSPSSLLMFDQEMPIIVPRVPHSSIICGDMAAILRRLGFTNVNAVGWDEDAINVGNIGVKVLPFFGEQPQRYDSPKDPSLRNWGNTYLLTIDDHRSWCLVDSGEDAMGSMKQVAQEVARKIGRIDTILSNLKGFTPAHHRYINGGKNWLTLSAQQMRNFSDMRTHLLTLGVQGVAEVCAAVRARSFLPYAHWWAPIGERPAGWPPSEYDLLNRLEREFADRKIDTGIVPWLVGDRFEIV